MYLICITWSFEESCKDHPHCQLTNLAANVRKRDRAWSLLDCWVSRSLLLLTRIVRFSNIMDREAPVSRRFPVGSTREDGREDGDHASKTLESLVPDSAMLQPLIVKKLSWNKVCIAWFYAMTSLRAISAQDFRFSVPSTSYNCSSNMICLGEAHVYNGSQFINSRIQVGRLSLVQEPSQPQSAGLAYYNQPVKLMDMSTRQSVSFNASFTIDMVHGPENANTSSADGMTFVISADNSTLGSAGAYLGFFDALADGTTAFKSIVVEFDNVWNSDSPFGDINGNHVSFDFMNITYAAAANASNAGVDLRQEVTVYAWVEYSSETKKLEVRISKNNRRPIRSLMSHTVDLFDVVEEYMWVGFSSGTGNYTSNFFIGDWTFESYWSRTKADGSKQSDGSKHGIHWEISVGIPIVLLAAIIVIALYMWKRSASRGQLSCQTTSIEDNTMVGQKPRQFSYKELRVATGGFNDESKLGEGGFGSVHRGVLSSSGTPVAVKKISSKSTQGEREFKSEVFIISQLRHRNLIQILGWCKDRAKKKYLLVYELMPNGSLDKALFRPPAEGPTACLSWKHRFNIVAGIAAALDYLHQGWNQQIIHRDVKASNIMLTEEWNAKLGDFGLARLVDHQKEPVSTMMAGTYGYIAPEVATTGKFTTKTDVFAFGAVVLEVACGRKALSVNLPEDEIILVDWVWHHLSVGDLMSTVDKRLGEDYDSEWMEVLLIIGLLCSHPSPLARPSMGHVVQVLAGDAPVPSIPASKPFSGSACDEYTSTSSESHLGSTSSVSTGTSVAAQWSTVQSFETSSSSN